MSYKLGLDMGSTTIKVVLLNDQNKVIYKSYERHFSKIREIALEKIIGLRDILKDKEIKVAITGSAGLGIAKLAEIEFVQEVFATAGAVKKYMPKTDVVIELGGEDAKIIFLKGTLEERMNSTCAGGTGAFIDQMASLLNVTVEELDQLSLSYKKLYPIASRCGVFAKSDIQPLINQGADKANIAASIFQAVVDQTIAGLAQGRLIEGNVLFLGGPLSFFKGLQKRFTETLGLDEDHAKFPNMAPYFVALGAALFAENIQEDFQYKELLKRFSDVATAKIETQGLPPLFADEKDYEKFCKRHGESKAGYGDIDSYRGKGYLGIDAGSTTTKIVLLDEKDNILYQDYTNNLGNPVEIVKEQLKEIYRVSKGKVQIVAGAVTGYGEDLIKSAFHVDFGVVETIAHYTAARHFNPNVDFIIDIGGQDMKCFKIKNFSVDGILLNEACSSGCGSFIETFAKSLGYDIATFAKLGLKGRQPVDLGTRCTVFMNSSVKQAQKNGASVEDISAGLAISVVKNALYKVIRARNASDLGQNVVVQGGTFLNDTVLRSFESELGRDVIRPQIAGLMGAYGAALYAKKIKTQGESTLITQEELNEFAHSSKAMNCNLCTNHCSLTVNTFNDGKKYIAGNKCQRPLGGDEENQDLIDLYEYKYKKISDLGNTKGDKGEIGIPLVLNMYENLPFWHSFFTELGYGVTISGRSDKAMYLKGQNTIPSDTVCYPAKLVHGHIKTLLDMGVKTIFYPCQTYNFNEGISDNHYNCPVVAYYPEVINGNMPVNDIKFLYPYISLNDEKVFQKKIFEYLSSFGFDIKKDEVAYASMKAYEAYENFKYDIKRQGRKAIEQGGKTVILAGRPYHIDPEINHGINKLLTGLGFTVLSEDSIQPVMPYEGYQTLNQWTYHARMYNAARYCTKVKNVEMIQLVSFGCGLDAITTDEVRDILEDGNKLYTGIKIDEINNLGAIKIRIRSLLAAMEERGAKK